jgi:hypothetical protein
MRRMIPLPFFSDDFQLPISAQTMSLDRIGTVHETGTLDADDEAIFVLLVLFRHAGSHRLSHW